VRAFLIQFPRRDKHAVLVTVDPVTRAEPCAAELDRDIGLSFALLIAFCRIDSQRLDAYVDRRQLRRIAYRAVDDDARPAIGACFRGEHVPHQGPSRGSVAVHDDDGAVAGLVEQLAKQDIIFKTLHRPQRAVKALSCPVIPELGRACLAISFEIVIQVCRRTHDWPLLEIPCPPRQSAGELVLPQCRQAAVGWPPAS
jgi:hypothetical protein